MRRFATSHGFAPSPRGDGLDTHMLAARRLVIGTFLVLGRSWRSASVASVRLASFGVLGHVVWRSATCSDGVGVASELARPPQKPGNMKEPKRVASRNCQFG
jgi:hypothetical protein